MEVVLSSHETAKNRDHRNRSFAWSRKQRVKLRRRRFLPVYMSRCKRVLIH